MTISYKILKQKGIDVFKYLRIDKSTKKTDSYTCFDEPNAIVVIRVIKPHWYTYDKVRELCMADRLVLVPILLEHFPMFVRKIVRNNKIGENSTYYNIDKFINFIYKSFR